MLFTKWVFWLSVYAFGNLSKYERFFMVNPLAPAFVVVILVCRTFITASGRNNRIVVCFPIITYLVRYLLEKGIMSEKLVRFVDLLKTIFELDKSDLNFGIYRIMNIRKEQIEDFLTKKLPEQIRAILEPVATENREKIHLKMKELEKQAAQFDADVEKNKQYLYLKEQYTVLADIPALEADVYSYLFNFFSRYYDEGDFISKRRYKEGVYAIPYEGEEVKLYWANQDQYYIKTTENFKDYSFTSDNITVRFMLVDATTEQNNNKENGKKRAFMLFTENEEQPGIKTFEKNDNELIIRFAYDLSEEKQKELNDKNYVAIKEYIVRNHDKLIPLITPSITFKKEQISPIQKHLYSYVAKNTFDYFIHKDLGGFLNHELDFFIKNEIVRLDEIDTGNVDQIYRYLAKVRAVKRAGKIIIDFLAQIENFQKRLWLKKKFIISTDWCITLDKVPEELYEEIRNNKAQVQEWIDLYTIDEVIKNGDLELAENWTNPPTLEFLRANKYLVIDTKHFNPLFKDKIISTIENLDEETNGILIHSENFQALNIIKEKYKEKIDCIYIDPPYNTSASEILYKNGYKDSSWLSLISDRCYQAKDIMSKNGVFAFAIDDTEEKLAHNVLDLIFNNNELGTVVVRNNPSGRPMKTGFAVSHEYVLFYSKNPNVVVSKVDRDENLLKRYKEQDEIGSFMWELLRKRGSDSERTDSPKAYYPIYYNGKSFRLPRMTWNDNLKVWEDIEPSFKDEIECWPIDEKGVHRRWRWGVETAKENIADLMYKVNGVGTLYYKYRPPEGMTVTTNWIDSKYSSTEHGTGYLKKLFTEYALFSYPKSIYAVEDSLRVMGMEKGRIALDFFAGSATTGHAVINLNRENDGNTEGNRKYILVEMGDYFNTVTKPRMQKVIYAKDWKDGRPTSRHTGISHLMKYFRLESYEDTLTNIEFSDSPEGKSLKFGNDYLINYMLDVETKGSLLNIEKFKEPFDYCLKITEKNEVKETNIDLIETFNYLIGLNVARQDALRFFKATSNNGKEYEASVDLKEDPNGNYSFKQLEGTLNDGSRILVIWRNISDNIIESNAALDAYFQKNRRKNDDRNFDTIYVNGDNNLENIRPDNEKWKVRIIEKEFLEKMFED
jgi:adenine-specific DNA-methyltransferase